MAEAVKCWMNEAASIPGSLWPVLRPKRKFSPPHVPAKPLVEFKKPGIRAFLMSQASDPILATACAPVQTRLQPFNLPKERRRR